MRNVKTKDKSSRRATKRISFEKTQRDEIFYIFTSEFGPSNGIFDVKTKTYKGGKIFTPKTAQLCRIKSCYDNDRAKVVAATFWN